MEKLRAKHRDEFNLRTFERDLKRYRAEALSRGSEMTFTARASLVPGTSTASEATALKDATASRKRKLKMRSTASREKQLHDEVKECYASIRRLQDTGTATFFKEFAYPTSIEEVEETLRIQDSEMHARISLYSLQNSSRTLLGKSPSKLYASKELPE